MGVFDLMPARAQAKKDEDTDDICDLDVVISRRVTFTFQGKKHEILPITVERLFEFWNQMNEYKKLASDGDAKASNKAYLKIIKTVCGTLTEKDCDRMSIVQKALLIKHICSKVVGTEIDEDGQKKKLIQAPSRLSG